MSHKRFASYVRILRKKTGFTQRELACLLSTSRNHVSRMERLHAMPGRDKVLMLMVVFQVTADDLFPHAYESLKKRVRQRALNMHEKLQGDARNVTRDKLNALEAVLSDGEDT